MLTGQAQTGVFMAVQAINDTTFTYISGDITGLSAFDSGAVTLPAGSVLFGKFTSVKTNSGTALAYNA